MRPLDQLAEIAQKAVEIGGIMIKNSRPKIVTEKKDRDTVTDVDLKIERKIRAYLAEHTPEIGFTGEEEGAREGSDGTLFWALDPIDGTANFTHGIPICAVQVALINEGVTTVAAISLPHFGMQYYAATGRGAYMNAKKIRTSDTAKLSKAIISIGDYATGSNAEKKNEERIAVTSALVKRVERVRMFGSAAYDLAWLAEGRIDATVMMSNNMIDVSAGILIAREAGAEVTDTSGNWHDVKSTNIVAAAPGIARELLECIKYA
ncbi:inositol monophosphatase [Actinosynnema sp. NPDC050801]|uniref:inositol monophosphatase family protein n=1 Tax=unclassified Actinosynnema TaxID=2637065 RepID=UPI0033E62B0A